MNLRSLRIALVLFVSLAIIPVAEASRDIHLTLKNVKSGKVTRCDVNSDGKFSCPSLPPGEYAVSIVVQADEPNTDGGQTAERRGIVSYMEPRLRGVSMRYTVLSPRDAASGQASGKRSKKQEQTQETTVSKEWNPATPILFKQTITIDQDCDGIEGSISGEDTEGKKLSLVRWSSGNPTFPSRK